MNKCPDAIRRRIEWQLADGRANSLVRENSGHWHLDEAAGGTLVTYAIAVRTILPAFATSGSERDSLVDTVKALRKTPSPRPQAGILIPRLPPRERPGGTEPMTSPPSPSIP